MFLALFQKQSLPVVMNYLFLLNITSTFVTSFAAIYEALKKNQFYVLCAPWIVVAAIGHGFLYIQDILVLPQLALDHLFLTDTYFYLLWVPRTLFCQ